MLLALLDANDVCINVIDADSAPQGYRAVPCDHYAVIGMRYVDGAFEPYTPPMITAPHIIDTKTFRDRFTDDELAAVLNLAYSGDASVRLLLLKIQTTGEIDLQSDAVINGMAYLVSKGVITAARKAEILA